jgi:hypothetical protein
MEREFTSTEPLEGFAKVAAMGFYASLTSNEYIFGGSTPIDAIFMCCDRYPDVRNFRPAVVECVNLISDDRDARGFA